MPETIERRTAGLHPESLGSGAQAEATIREYRPSDLERLKEIHRQQGFDYQMPDLDDQVFAISSVAEEDGTVQAAAFLQITAEAYLFLDPNHADARTRWQTLLRIHEDMRWQARQAGLAQVTCWVPPNLPKGFLRRLDRLGWQEEPETWKRRAFHIRKAVL